MAASVKLIEEFCETISWRTFRVMHGQCDSIIFPKTFSFERFKLLSNLCLADSRLLYFWQVLESIHKFIIEIHFLQCLFVRGSNKKQMMGKIISNFTKGEAFLFLMTTKCSSGKSHNVALLLLPPRKGLPLLFSLAKKRIYLDTQLKAELTDLFWKLPGCFLFPRVGIGWWTLL